MKQKIKSLFKSQWFVGAFFFILSSSISITVFWKTIKLFLVIISDFLLIKTEISIGGLILFFTASLSLLILVYWLIAIYKDRKNISHKQSYMEYTEDYIEDYLHRWIYLKGSVSPSLTLLGIFCPKCRCKLIDSRCPECLEYYSGGYKTDDELKSIILGRIERKYFPPQIW